MTLLHELVVYGLVAILLIYLWKKFRQQDDDDEDTLIDQFFSVTINTFQNQRHGDHPEPERTISWPESACLYSNSEPVAHGNSGRVSMTNEFQNQRHGDHARYQFAVLFMSERKKLIHLSKSMKCKNNHPSKKLTDSECKIFPPDGYVVNYLTARPLRLGNGVTEHAESLLLGKLDLLMEKFGESRCETIVLYTWLLPCNDCKAEIITKFKGPLAKKKHVILAYTIKMKDEKNEDGIVRELKSAGIEVRKVKSSHLKPKQN